MMLMIGLPLRFILGAASIAIGLQLSEYYCLGLDIATAHIAVYRIIPATVTFQTVLDD